MIGHVQKYCLFLVLYVKCGMSSMEGFSMEGFSMEGFSMEGHIIGGSYAKTNQFPHAAYLAINCDEAWICGASILNHKILLTAAHCVDDAEDCKITASAGNADLKRAIRRGIKGFVMHEGFNPNTVANDIALVIVRQSFRLGRDIKRVFLMKFKLKSIKGAVVAGWGVVNEITSKTSVKLKYTSQQVLPLEGCEEVTHMQQGMLCAKSVKDNNRPTQGDSGSALIIPSGQQIGLVSFRKAKLPDLVVYTHVPYYLPWIRKHAMDLYCG